MCQRLKGVQLLELYEWELRNKLKEKPKIDFEELLAIYIFFDAIRIKKYKQKKINQNATINKIKLLIQDYFSKFYNVKINISVEAVEYMLNLFNFINEDGKYNIKNKLVLSKIKKT